MVKVIEINQFLERVEKNPDISAASSLLKKIDVLSVTGLHGSSHEIFGTSLFNRNRQFYLYIFNDADAAGDFDDKVNQLVVYNEVTLFPSAYKRAVECG